MTTTAIHPGHSVSGILNQPKWGEGYTDEERETLDAALIEKFEELARAATGDDSIVYCAHTSEIQYECHGRTTAEHHCLSPKNVWIVGADEEIDWGELAERASEWVSEHIEDILAEE